MEHSTTIAPLITELKKDLTSDEDRAKGPEKQEKSFVPPDPELKDLTDEDPEQDEKDKGKDPDPEKKKKDPDPEKKKKDPDPVSMDPDQVLDMLVEGIEQGVIELYKSQNLPDDKRAMSEKEKENWKKAFMVSAPAAMAKLMTSPYAPLALCIIGTFGSRLLLIQKNGKKPKD